MENDDADTFNQEFSSSLAAARLRAGIGLTHRSVFFVCMHLPNTFPTSETYDLKVEWSGEDGLLIIY
jgi:hypothetical protein